MAASRVPKYCLFRPRNLAYVRIHGKVCYLGPWNSPESRNAYSRLIAKLDDVPAAPTREEVKAISTEILLVSELAAAYMEFAKTEYVKNGKLTDQIGNVKRALRFLVQLYGTIDAVDFGPLALKALRAHMVSHRSVHPKNKTPVSYTRKTINSTVGCIRRAFRWAASEELVPAAIHQALTTVSDLKEGKTAAHDRPPVPPVPDEVVERTLPHLPPIVAVMVRLQRLTGVRPGELCQLRPGDIDRSDSVWTYRPASHKTEHHGGKRVVFIGPQAQDLIRPFLLRAADACCFSPAESEQKRRDEQRAKRKTRVQPSQADRRKAAPKRTPKMAYSTGSYRRAVVKSIVKANRQAIAGTEAPLIPRWAPNQLRHTCGTDVRKKFGLEASQTVLGHKHAKTTEVYAERDYALRDGEDWLNERKP